MYELILKALFCMNNRSTREEQALYLKALKPAARALWRAYRPGYGNTVTASYDQPTTQAVYMLRYFPQYATIVDFVLEELFKKSVLPFNDELIHVSHFGCGPAPELWGIMRFIKRRFPRAQMLVAHLFDVASKQWAPCRAITLDYLIPSMWDKGLFEARAVAYDFTQRGSISSLLGRNGAAKLPQ
jgi:hypothetical protein